MLSPEEFSLLVNPVPYPLQRQFSLACQEGSLFSQVNFFDGTSSLNTPSLLIFGITDTPPGESGLSGPDRIRKELYLLSGISSGLSIIDIGNLKAGHSQQDGLAAVLSILEWCSLHEAQPLILGGNEASLEPIFSFLDGRENLFNCSIIDSCIDFRGSYHVIPGQTSYSHTIHKTWNHLFSLSFLAFQTYLSPEGTTDKAEAMLFDTLRLGEYRENPVSIEPYLRDSNLVVFDCHSIRNSDFPAVRKPSPNGLYAEEACQLAFFSGLSDQKPIFLLTGYLSEKDQSGISANLAAQITWFFLDGAGRRAGEFPASGLKSLVEKQVIPLKSNEPIHFFQSQRTGKWWMEVQGPDTNQQTIVVACLEEDLNAALAGEVPPRWWKTFQKLS